jgi:MFS family permease
VVLVATGMLTLADGSLTLLLPPYLGGIGVQEATIGAVVASAGLASLVMRIPAGLSYRRHRAVRLVTAGAVGSSAAFLLISAMSLPATIAPLVALDGAGFAVASTTAMAAIVDHRPASISLPSLMGWFTGSIGAGYALAGFVGGSLSDAIGIGPALRILAAAPLVAAGLMGWALARMPAPHEHAAPPPGPRRVRDWLRAVPATLWTAVIVALYINLVNGGLHAFFPLYGLSIGLTLTQVGVLTGIHATLAAGVRFGSGALFHRIPHRKAIPVLVFIIGAGMVALAGPRSVIVLALIFAAIGLSRGVLRVASGALAVEEAGPSGRERGGASGLYLAGLDLGSVVGPLAGGAAAQAVGLRAAFPLLGATFSAAYLALALVRRVAESRRSQPAGAPNLYSGHG